jgi:putative ABC transport system permease protein
MTALELWNRLLDRFRRDSLSRELEAELRFHQGMLERDARLQGASAEAAHRAGVLALRNSTYNLERTRDMWSLGWVDDLLNDVRYAGRVVRHNPAFSLAVVLTLALGIGANTAIFSVVNAVLLRPLPYAEPERLYSIWTVPATSPNDRNPVSYPDVVDWEAQNTVFTGIGAYAFNRFELTTPDGSEVVRAAIGTPRLYDVLGARPLLGRMPRPDEDRVAVAAISYNLWQRRFGGARDVIGRPLLLNTTPYTIIGVMPAGFEFPGPDVQVWTSMYQITVGTPGGAANPWLTNRGMRGYRTVARLKPGVTPEVAERRMNDLHRRLAEMYPAENGGVTLRLQAVTEDNVRGIAKGLWLMLGATALVLLLACVNVAHLMLARTSTRTREIGIRRALGAHRGRVARQLMTESVVLSGIGGLAGVLVAYASVRLLVRLSPADIPRLGTISIDPATLAFAAAASLLTGLLFGLAPAAVAWSGADQGVLKSQARGGAAGQGGRLRSVLMSAEIAFALVLLVGAGLMVRSFASLLAKDIGFTPANVVSFAIGIPPSRYPNPADNADVVRRVLENIRGIPGVELVGASTSLPPTRMQSGVGYTVEGRPQPPGRLPTATFVPATAGFLPALGIPLIEGRFFKESDDAQSTPVVLINRALAKREFGDRSALGQRIVLGSTPHTIVGIVGDVSYEGINQPIRPTMYVSWPQTPGPGAWVVVKTNKSQGSVMGAITPAVHAADPAMNPRDVRSMEDVVSDSVVRPRFQTWLLGVFGGMGLLLAIVGVYGVIAYGVAQRTAEIGVRIALGATPRSVVGLLLARTMLPVAIGLAIGVVVALGLSRFMASMLSDVSPKDVLTFASTTALLAGAAMGAAYLPAARAARLDPLKALRSD